MKKNIIKKASIVFLSVTMLMATACNTKINSTFACKATDYITLGKYKEIEATIDSSTIENNLMDKRITNDQKENITYTDVTRAAQDTDKLIMDFTGTIGGEEITGFCADEYELVLGTDTFTVDGFTDALYGLTAGQTNIVTLMVPEDFEDNIDYAGKRIVFEISVTNVQQANVPMITDAYAKQYYNCDTVEEYKTKIKAELQEEIDSQVLQAKKEAVLTNLQNECTVKSYPEDLLATKTEELTKSISFYGTLQNLTNDEYCQKQFNMSFDEYVKKSLAQQLILQAIVETEDLKIMEYDYKGSLESFANDNGFSDKDTFVERYGKEKIVNNMLLQKAQDIVMNSAVITEK